MASSESPVSPGWIWVPISRRSSEQSKNWSDFWRRHRPNNNRQFDVWLHWIIDINHSLADTGAQNCFTPNIWRRAAQRFTLAVSFVSDAGKFDEALEMACYFETSSMFSRNLHVTKNSHSFAGSQTLLASESEFYSTGNLNSTETVGDARRLGLVWLMMKYKNKTVVKATGFNLERNHICLRTISFRRGNNESGFRIAATSFHGSLAKKRII